MGVSLFPLVILTIGLRLLRHSVLGIDTLVERLRSSRLLVPAADYHKNHGDGRGVVDVDNNNDLGLRCDKLLRR